MNTKILYTTGAILWTMCATSSLALAQDAAAQNTRPQYNTYATQQDPVMKHIAYLQKEWARIKYQIPEKETQLSAIHRLEEYAAKLTASYPNRAEPKIWEGIILSTDAGIVKGLSALGKVKKAKELFEMSLEQSPYTMNGSAHTSLGSLYYQVPGWPIAFGDNDKAEKHLKTALQINPHGIDPNFFYGDFLLHEDRYDEAKIYFERALAAPERPDRPLADAGRRQEIKAKLAKMLQKGKNQDKPRYN